MVVLFSLVAMTNKSVCQCLALFGNRPVLVSHLIGVAHLAYHRL